jgi:hypothetical protein
VLSKGQLYAHFWGKVGFGGRTSETRGAAARGRKAADFVVVRGAAASKYHVA